MPDKDETEDLVSKAEIFLDKTKEYLRSVGYTL